LVIDYPKSTNGPVTFTIIDLSISTSAVLDPTNFNKFPAVSGRGGFSIGTRLTVSGSGLIPTRQYRLILNNDLNAVFTAGNTTITKSIGNINIALINSTSIWLSQLSGSTGINSNDTITFSVRDSTGTTTIATLGSVQGVAGNISFTMQAGTLTPGVSYKLVATSPGATSSPAADFMIPDPSTPVASTGTITNLQIDVFPNQVTIILPLDASTNIQGTDIIFLENSLGGNFIGTISQLETTGIVFSVPPRNAISSERGTITLNVTRNGVLQASYTTTYTQTYNI
jgi:hypothetical protein